MLKLRCKRGMAMPIVIFVLMISFIILTATILQVESNTSSSRIDFYDKKAELIAESGINLLLLKIKNNKSDIKKIIKCKDFFSEINSNYLKIFNEGFYKIVKFDIINDIAGKITIEVTALGKFRGRNKKLNKILSIRVN